MRAPSWLPLSLVAVGAVLAALALVSVASISEVSAHAKLVRAEPAPGSTVTAAPVAVRAWFTDELDVRRSTISVWDGQGRRLDKGNGGVDLNDLDRKSLATTLKRAGAGTYRVKWRAVSADDLNVAEGEFRFTVAPAQ
jgi:methionine-rich copper-binding protein CopC